MLAGQVEQNTVLLDQNAVLFDQNAVLVGRVGELEGLVAALRAQLGRDSSNSSRPPSSDSPFVKKPAAKRSMRTKSGKRPGKQPGSEGTTPRLVEDPDETLVVAPPACAGCGADLGDAAVFEVQRRQVVCAPRPRRGRMSPSIRSVRSRVRCVRR